MGTSDTNDESRIDGVPASIVKDRVDLFTTCCVISIAMICVSLAIAGLAVVRIFETTPFMGIPVDEDGVPLPIQGYSQLGFGVAGILLFAILGIVFWLCRARALENQRSNRSAGQAS